MNRTCSIVSAAALSLVSGALARAAEPVPATIADVAWLAGDWSKTGSGELAQEIWTDPEAGSMTGLFRWVRNGRVLVHEFLLLEEREETVEMRLRHFGAGMRAWEEEALVFDLISLEESTLVFEQRDDDTPTTLRYELLEGGVMRFTFVEIGEEREQRFTIDFVRAE